MLGIIGHRVGLCGVVPRVVDGGVGDGDKR